jgi:hypothetical protein
MIRQPAVAGRFYPDHPLEAQREVDAHVGTPPAQRQRAIGCVVPHAGWMYSGHVAGAVYARLELPRRIIILCPRHYPVGQPLAILTEGAWRTPLGDAPVDAELATAIAHAFPQLREDSAAHAHEHSLEVQLPFLQRLVPEFRFVPIALGTDRYGVLEELGRALAEVVAREQAAGGSVLLLASSDMNHYESDAITRGKDRQAIDRVLALDPRGLFETVRREGISMCGYGPTTAMLVAARQLGATRAELVKYATSGDVSGDMDRVVGYAGIVVS